MRKPATPRLTGRHRQHYLKFFQTSDAYRFDNYRPIFLVSNKCVTDCCIVEHDVFDGGSVLVLGVISYDGFTDLYMIRNEGLTGL